MSYSSYLIQTFDNTHENLFFRDFSEKLQKIYDNIEGEHILIGNLSCQGNQLDAVFICKGQISVIDFKNYGGKLIFSENNPWLITNNDGKQVFVSGGGSIRNPFNQIKVYRRALFELLSKNEKEILDNNHDNIEWAHTSCIVLFHEKVNYDINSIPVKIKSFFIISDSYKIYNLLKDKNTPTLNLSDNEIRKILKILDVRENNRFDSNKDYVGQKQKKNDKNNLQTIKQLIPKDIPDNELKKILLYYQILINLEGMSDAEIKDLYDYFFDNKDVNPTRIIDISKNNEFYNLFIKNQNPNETKYPSKYLFIAKKVNIDNKPVPLLHCIITISDSLNENNLTINTQDFKIYTKALEKLRVDNDTIDELSVRCDNASTLEEKLNCIKERLFENATFYDTISIGFSSEASYTLQLNSELKSLLRKNINNNSLLSRLLVDKKINSNIKKLKIDKYIKVTKLNREQEEAVRKSFENILTVITGPPGTGKTQIIVNILANAIMNGHKVLFASKNNKAVDNVIERFSDLLDIDEKDFLLRFGPKDQIRNKTAPTIDSFVQKHANKIYHNENKIYDEKIRLFESISELKNILKDISDLLSTLSDNKKPIIQNDEVVIEFDINKLNYLLKEIQFYKKNFLLKTWFYLFKKKKIIEEIGRINNELNPSVNKYISDNNPYIKIDSTIFDSIYDNITSIKELKQKKDEYKQFLNHRNKLMRILELKYANIENQIDEKTISISNEILKLKIRSKLSSLIPANILSYRNKIPSNEIWKDNEIENFYHVCLKFLDTFNIASVTSLSIKNSFPLHDNLFDLIVIDEASQCDMASILPLLYRANRIVVIGDPLQLPHISAVKDFEEQYLEEKLKLDNHKLNYKNNSLYDFCFEAAISSEIETYFLNEHFRSHEQIIKFSSENFYGRILGQSLDIKTNQDDFHYEPIGVNWVNIHTNNDIADKVNPDEISAAIGKARSLRKLYPNASIGIITPFVNQKKAFDDNLKPEEVNFFTPDTVHKYQGDERDIIIYSLVVNQNSKPFTVDFVNYVNRNINKPNLINVALTRAKSSLIIVGDHRFCKTLVKPVDTPLYLLAKYVESLGKFINP